MDSSPCFKIQRKKKELQKNYNKNAKNRSKKALAKGNQNIKQTMKKDSKICQKQHKKNKIFKKKGFTHLPPRCPFSVNEKWWTGVKYFIISLQLRSEERILSW